MTAEIVIGSLLAAAGFGALAPVRRDIPAAARVWLSVPTGAAVYLMTALVLLTVAETLDPGLALGITVGLGLVGLVVAGLRGDLDRREVAWAASSIGIAVVTVIVARTMHMTRLTPDSLRYLLGATDLVLPDAFEEVHKADLLIRQIGLPALHALSDFVDRRYVASIGPLFGVSGIGLFSWLAWQFTKGMDDRGRRWLVVSAVLFFGTSNRLLYDVFYINTHIQVAVFLLIAVAGSWLAVSRRQIGWAWPAGLALASTLLMRPEAPLVAAIVLVAVGASRATWPVRLAMTLPSIFVMSLWYGIALWQNANSGDVISLTAPVFGSLVAVTGAAAIVVVGGLQQAQPWIQYADRALLAGLALLVVLYGIRTPDILVTALEATLRNLTYGGIWLLTWVAALTLLAVALIVQRIPDARLWTVPLWGFALLFWLLPLLRGGPFRVGSGDSGNRILAHILGVVVSFLVLAAVEAKSANGDSDPSPQVGVLSQ